MRLKVPKTRGMLRREAAAWLARLKGGRDPDIEHKFRLWRDKDPAHAEAFERVTKSYERAGLLRYSALTSPFARRPPAPKRSRFQRYNLAAALALILISSAGVFVLLRYGPWNDDTEAVMLSTKVGEIRRVSLADGSSVILDTDTRIEIELGRKRRRALVETGRARFEIAQASEPFVIEAGDTSAAAARAVLDVEKFGNESGVDVLSGRARIGGSEPAAGELLLGAGDRVTAISGRRAASRSLAATADWTRGMLEFDATPLATAVALANRYSERKIVLAADLRQQRVTGAFRAGDSQGLASALAEAFHLSVIRTADGNLFLSPKKRQAVGAASI